MSLKSTVFAKQRASSSGGTYASGWMLKSELRAMIDSSDADAIGFTPKEVSSDKFKGTVIEITPFKLKAKK